MVPPEPVARFWERLPPHPGGDQRLAVYANGWHLLLRDLAAEEVLLDIWAWVESPSAPLPSGADVGALQRITAGSRGKKPR
jgi:acylglycerol lipase